MRVHDVIEATVYFDASPPSCEDVDTEVFTAMNDLRGAAITSALFGLAFTADVNMLAGECSSVEPDRPKDPDTRPLLDSGATHHATPYSGTLTNLAQSPVRTVRGVNSTCFIKALSLTCLGDVKGEFFCFHHVLASQCLRFWKAMAAPSTH
jgi:hypothetical protein